MSHRISLCLRTVAIPLVLVAIGVPMARADIFLGEIVGGGDGTPGSATPGVTGINPDDGTFTTGYFDNHVGEANGVNPQKVAGELLADGTTGSPYIDAVFLLPTVPYPITSLGDTGPVYDFMPGDEQAAGMWDYILKDRTADYGNPMNLGGRVFASGVGIHAAGGITFDLDAIRAKQVDPSEVGFFSAFVGMDGCSCGNVRLHVVQSNETDILDFYTNSFTPGQGAPMNMVIQPEAKYLTLATGVNGDATDCCDHGGFGDAKLSRLPKVLVSRTLPTGFLPGDTITVNLDVTVPSPVASLEIREVPPRGFAVSNVSDGGSTLENDPSPGRQAIDWKFTGAAIQDMTISYDLTVPSPYPNSAFPLGGVTADGESAPIYGDSKFTGGSDGNISEALVVYLKQPSTNGSMPGYAAERSDYISDGDTLNEQTVTPAVGESISPDFQGASIALGPVPGNTASLTWTRKTGACQIDLGSVPSNDNSVAYMAYYAVNATGQTVKVSAGSSSDDSEQILVDGREVWIHDIGRGASCQLTDHSAQFDLTPGKHLVLQKVFEGTGGFNGAFRFEDEDQNPFVAIRMTLDPGADKPSPGDPAYSAGGAFVLRSVPSSLDVGESAIIALKLRIRTPPVVDGLIVETLPDCWTISEVSDGGTVAGHTITWNLSGPLSDRNLLYRATLDSNCLDAALVGTATLGGKTTDILGTQAFTRGVMDAAGFIKQWLVLGPLDTAGLWLGDQVDPNANPDAASATPENGDIRLDFLTDGTTTEKTIRPFDGMRFNPAFGGNGVTGAKSLGLKPLARECSPATPTWEKFICSAGTFNNDDYFGEAIDAHATYGACYLTNTTGGDLTASIGFDSDDSFIAFLNGNEIGAWEQGVPCSSVACGRGYGAEDHVQDISVPFTIPAGESFLLTRVHDGGGASGHRLRFQDAAGNPILPPALKVSLLSSGSPPAVYVRRSLSTLSYRLPQTPTVTLHVESSGPHAVLVKEVLPLGWSATTISDSGSLAAGVITWNLASVSGTKDLSYKLMAGDCPAGGKFCGNGADASEYTVDGGATDSLNGDSSFSRDTGGTDYLAPWDARDIGTSGGGTQREGPSAVGVTGKGGGIKTGKDEFRFVSIPSSGDFEIAMKIGCLEDLGGSGLCGLMVRDVYDNNSAHAFFAMNTVPPAGGGIGKLKGYYRNKTKGSSTSNITIITDQADVLALPIWLKLKRVDMKLFFQRSNDGANYVDTVNGGKDIGTASSQVGLGTTPFIGIAVTGGGSGATHAGIQEVTGVPALPDFPAPVSAPNAPQNLAAAAGDKKVDLTWSDPAAGGGPFNAFRILRDGGTAGEVASSVHAFSDTGLTNGQQHCYQVKAVQGSTLSAASNQSCATPAGGGQTFRRGDVDGNGKIEVTDAIGILGHLFLGDNTAWNCPEAADTDNDTKVDVTDAVNNLNFQFLGGTPPASPGPRTCGPDDGPVFLGCGTACN